MAMSRTSSINETIAERLQVGGRRPYLTRCVSVLFDNCLLSSSLCCLITPKRGSTR
jgi:hypothetical protein